MQTEQDLEKLVHTHTAALLRYCTGPLWHKGCPQAVPRSGRGGCARHSALLHRC